MTKGKKGEKRIGRLNTAYKLKIRRCEPN